LINFFTFISFLQVAIESHTTAQRNRRASESDSMHDIMSGATRQVNILQMLSKAQDEYVKVGTHWEPHRVMMGMKFMVLSRDPVQILSEALDE
jgi:hypothetical protein